MKTRANPLGQIQEEQEGVGLKYDRQLMLERQRFARKAFETLIQRIYYYIV